MKVGVIGVGAVGAATAMAIALRAPARDLILIDRPCTRQGSDGHTLRRAAFPPGDDRRTVNHLRIPPARNAAETGREPRPPAEIAARPQGFRKAPP